MDATINGGGHSIVILQSINPGGTLLGIDRDCELIEAVHSALRRFQSQNKIILACDTYAHIRTIARKHHMDAVDGILFDLGFSTYHPETSRRGFSFLKADEPLDMRYQKNEPIANARDIINTWPEHKISSMIRGYGEERFSDRIAKNIVRCRRRGAIERVGELVAIIKEVVPAWYQRKKIHFATRTFQAFRIAVNGELDAITQAIPDAIDMLAPGGKLIIISFHSLEDRIVKTAFRDAERKKLVQRIYKKAVRPSSRERLENPRSRSAILRAVQKLS